MVNFARDRAMNEGFINNTFFDTSSAEKLPFKNSFFNHVFISFGFRNFSDKGKALSEIIRVLKKGGTLHFLEFAKVQNKTFSKIYDFYSYDSIRTHESQEETCEMLKSNGFYSAEYKNLFNGIVAIHRATK